ncbi:hypothetical protein CPSG_06042 [Coccidioides posadasii str. Silveira]|uniref:Uncharacterized protein n=1 Tax=Coccidioides posadasii (strain RMSCC 757 / Silveira) TaxID=443226 RepID=E9D890_COCPS|nr:hypothetical protein CPSG_06042 [Coccidioides posadasii str. Silveira]
MKSTSSTTYGAHLQRFAWPWRSCAALHLCASVVARSSKSPLRYFDTPCPVNQCTWFEVGDSLGLLMYQTQCRLSSTPALPHPPVMRTRPPVYVCMYIDAVHPYGVKRLATYVSCAIRQYVIPAVISNLPLPCYSVLRVGVPPKLSPGIIGNIPTK